MNKLIKGDLVMTNVADKDIDMYVSAGWKLDNVSINKKVKINKKYVKSFKEAPIEDALSKEATKAYLDDEPIIIENVENRDTSDTIEE